MALSHTYIHTHILYIYIYVCMYVCVMCSNGPFAYLHTHTHIPAQALGMCTYTYIHTHTPVQALGMCTYTYIYTHIHTYLQATGPSREAVDVCTHTHMCADVVTFVLTFVHIHTYICAGGGLHLTWSQTLMWITWSFLLDSKPYHCSRIVVYHDALGHVFMSLFSQVCQ
jgi:hypothetical protein